MSAGQELDRELVAIRKRMDMIDMRALANRDTIAEHESVLDDHEARIAALESSEPPHDPGNVVKVSGSSTDIRIFLERESPQADPGTIFEIADGTYDSRDIDITGASNITIRAETKHGVRFFHDEPDRNKHWGIFSANQCDNVTFDGFHFSGRFPRAFNNYPEPSTNCTIRNCYIDSASWNGILLGGGSTNWTIDDCELWRCCRRMEGYSGYPEPSALRIDGGTGHIVRRTKIWNAWGEGVNFKNCHNVFLNDCDLFDNRTASAYFTGTSSAIIRNNRFVSQELWAPGGVTVPYAIHATIEPGQVQQPQVDYVIENNLIDGGTHGGFRFGIAWNRQNHTIDNLRYSDWTIHNNEIRNIYRGGWGLLIGTHDPNKPRPQNCSHDCTTLNTDGRIEIANPEFWSGP